MVGQEGSLGFTGTRQGMTKYQKAALHKELVKYKWLHHGDCIGADLEAHNIAKAAGLKVHIHPPTDPKLQAFCSGDAISEPKAYRDRNKDIVNETQKLIATPSGMQEKPYSGTWMTINYARKQNKRITIIYPNGSVEFDHGN